MKKKFKFKNNIDIKLGRDITYVAESLGEGYSVTWIEDGEEEDAWYTVASVMDALEKGHWIETSE